MRKKFDKVATKRMLTDWGKILVLLLDEAVVVLVVVLILRFFKISFPLPTAIILALVLGAFVFITHVAIIPSIRKRVVTGSEGMLGVEGRVVKLLNPLGTIVVNGEYWRAKSVEDSVDVDENVEIVGLDGLTLNVKRKGRQY